MATSPSPDQTRTSSSSTASTVTTVTTATSSPTTCQHNPNSQHNQESDAIVHQHQHQQSAAQERSAKNQGTSPSSARRDEGGGNRTRPGSSSGVVDKGEDDVAIEGLKKEIEKLKLRLEEERKKLNDVSCEFITFHSLVSPLDRLNWYSFAPAFHPFAQILLLHLINVLFPSSSSPRWSVVRKIVTSWYFTFCRPSCVTHSSLPLLLPKARLEALNLVPLPFSITSVLPSHPHSFVLLLNPSPFLSSHSWFLPDHQFLEPLVDWTTWVTWTLSSVDY